MALIIALLLFGAAAGPPQEMETPAKVQYALLQKILFFDRNLKARAGDEIVIGILYQDNFKSSRDFKDDLLQIVADDPEPKIYNVPLKFVVLDLSEKVDLAARAVKQNIDIFYVGPLRAVEIKTVTAVSRDKKIFTFTGVPAFVEAGLSTGIGIKAEKPQIIINLPAARAEGVEFNAQLLKLARIVE